MRILSKHEDYSHQGISDLFTVVNFGTFVRKIIILGGRVKIIACYKSMEYRTRLLFEKNRVSSGVFSLLGVPFLVHVIGGVVKTIERKS